MYLRLCNHIAFAYVLKSLMLYAIRALGFKSFMKWEEVYLFKKKKKGKEKKFNADYYYIYNCMDTNFLQPTLIYIYIYIYFPKQVTLSIY
jgi:hypothetical protein